MQDKHLFEYAVIRVMPKVEREEFLNVGIILYCPKQKFLETLFLVNEQRIVTFSAEIDIETLKANLSSFQRITAAKEDSGPIGQYDMAARFRWLTATRSTVIQCSKVHPGFTANPQETLKKLFGDLVL
ncbi:MAG: DUF3037 domain-containing protein [Chitinophagaceae bacterium]